MANQEGIDNIVDTYLSGKTIPPFKCALQKLLVPAGYQTGIGAGMFGVEKFFRRGKNREVELVAAYHIIEKYQTMFGNSCGNQSINLTHLVFSDENNHHHFDELCNRMHGISKQERVSHRYMGDEREGHIRETGISYACMGLIVGIMPVIPTMTIIPKFNNLETSICLLGSLVGICGFAVGGYFLGKRKAKRKLKELETHCAGLKEQYDIIFQQFIKEYMPRMSFGKEGLEKALVQG